MSLTVERPLDSMTGRVRANTVEFLSLLEQDDSEIVTFARQALIHRMGANDFRGALGENWVGCQKAIGADNKRMNKLDCLRRERFKQAVELWQDFPLEELEAIEKEHQARNGISKAVGYQEQEEALPYLY